MELGRTSLGDLARLGDGVRSRRHSSFDWTGGNADNWPVMCWRDYHTRRDGRAKVRTPHLNDDAPGRPQPSAARGTTTGSKEPIRDRTTTTTSRATPTTLANTRSIGSTSRIRSTSSARYCSSRARPLQQQVRRLDQHRLLVPDRGGTPLPEAPPFLERVPYVLGGLESRQGLDRHGLPR